MFLGTYRHSVDTKGRVAIPARFREQLPSGTVISKGAEGCLQVYPPQEWAQEQGLRLGSTRPTVRTVRTSTRTFTRSHNEPSTSLRAGVHRRHAGGWGICAGAD